MNISSKNPRSELTSRDLRDLKRAHELASQTPFIIRVSDVIGKLPTKALEVLPDKVSSHVASATKKSLETALNVALFTMDTSSKGEESNDWWHKFAVLLTGGVGGAFGFAALAVELPITTGIMLRSIADIARSEGEDLNQPRVRLECLNVFALEGGKKNDDDADTGFLATRMALTRLLGEAAEYYMKKAGTKATAPVFVKLIEQIAAKFGVTVSQKVASQAIPVVGGVAGATINTLFMDYYQDMARAHFILRRLERKYPPELIAEIYESL
ncbi:EcsC family protein [Candidatus Spyradosoma sp. SGI.093]|uniref:EcsC family protein n=1 Tax=Candidatus Spyradosoma sp. SGI.093 TaxID=3420583 RepID=UPI003CFEE40B